MACELLRCEYYVMILFIITKCLTPFCYNKIFFHSWDNFLRSDLIDFKGVHGKIGPTCRGFVKNFNLKFNEVATRIIHSCSIEEQTWPTQERYKCRCKLYNINIVVVQKRRRAMVCSVLTLTISHYQY